MVIFVKCHIFEGQLPQNHTEHDGFDANALQREIFCAKTPEMMGVSLRALEPVSYTHLTLPTIYSV